MDNKINWRIEYNISIYQKKNSILDSYIKLGLDPMIEYYSSISRGILLEHF